MFRMTTKLMLPVAIATALLLAGSAPGQFAPALEVANPLPTAPRHVATEDFDDDGDLDLVVLSSSDNRIRYYENRLAELTGDFAPEVVVSTQVSGGGSGMVVADIDGDGDLDLLYSSQTSQEAAWFENRFAEDGAFGPRRVITSSVGYSRYPQLVDVDADGALDLVLLDQTTGGNLRYWRNRLNEVQGDFAPFANLKTGLTSPFAIAFADLDLDGDSDVVVSRDNTSTLSWLENEDGMGTFGNPQTLVTKAELGNSQAYDLLVEDLDGDGYPDILFSGQTNDLKWVKNRLGEVSADFTAPSIVSGGVTFPRPFALYDVDGDGFRDIVFGESLPPRIDYVPNRLQTVDANFGAKVTLETFAANPQDFEWRDVDGDGDDDRVIVTLGSPRVGFFENTTFDPTPAITVTTPTAPSLELLLGTVELGTTPAVQSAIVSNPGTADLNTTITLSNSAAGQFTLPQIPPAILDKFSTGTLQVAFAPTTLGAISGQVSIQTNTTSGTLLVSLSGTGIDTIAPTSSVTSPTTGTLTQPDGDLSIAYQALDGGSGVADVELFYSFNGGPATSLGVHTASPIAIDVAPLGGTGTYGFYTRARDVASNVESAPAAPDVMITLTIDTGVADWKLSEE